jgi:hypothetical protein
MQGFILNQMGEERRWPLARTAVGRSPLVVGKIAFQKPQALKRGFKSKTLNAAWKRCSTINRGLATPPKTIGALVWPTTNG